MAAKHKKNDQPRQAAALPIAAVTVAAVAVGAWGCSHIE
jgi:hypothetical protein